MSHESVVHDVLLLLLYKVGRKFGSCLFIVSGMILKEAALCSLTGALCGTAVGAVLVFPFTTLIETSLKLPYLTPDGGNVILYACIAIAVTILAGCVASARTASALSRVDPGTTLREGA